MAKDAVTAGLPTVRTILWERCWDPGFCVHIPWPVNKDVCVSAHVCVRIAEDAGRYYIEIQLNGVKQQFDLVNTCYPALSIGLASLEVCSQEPVFDPPGKLKSIKIVVKVCLGIDVGPIHARRCFDVFSETISFFTLTAKDLESAGLGRMDPKRTYIAFVEGALSR